LLVFSVKPRGGDLEKINVLIEAGKLRPVIAKSSLSIRLRTPTASARQDTFGASWL
jgi:hypothetical protein